MLCVCICLCRLSVMAFAGLTVAPSNDYLIEMTCVCIMYNVESSMGSMDTLFQKIYMSSPKMYDAHIKKPDTINN